MIAAVEISPVAPTPAGCRELKLARSQETIVGCKSVEDDGRGTDVLGVSAVDLDLGRPAEQLVCAIGLRREQARTLPVAGVVVRCAPEEELNHAKDRPQDGVHYNADRRAGVW